MPTLTTPFQQGQDLFRRGEMVPTDSPEFREIFNGYTFEFGFSNGIEGRLPRMTEPYYVAGHNIGKKIKKGEL